jgi:SulP family sulfate permease
VARTRYQADGTEIPLRRLPAAALRAVFREGYGRADLQHDMLAGLVVGIVALPLAMALAIGVGVAPQHGLATAIVAGFVVAALGGSRTQVTGPTAAFIVVLAPIYARFGLAGLLVAGLLGGAVLVAMGLLRLGRFIQYVPHPVTTGFTAGIATVIATMQVKDLFGLTLATEPEHYVERVIVMFEARHTASFVELAIGALTFGLLLGLPRVTRRVPAPVLALPAAALVGAALAQLAPGARVATIASRFHTVVDGEIVAGIPQAPPLPLIPWLASGPQGLAFSIGFDDFRVLLAGALAIAMLGAIESLLSAVVADGMARTKHDPDAELIALGIGNLLVPFFGGIPATGAIARTATNIRSGARSPIAAMIHALVVLVAVLALAPLLGYLPMSALAALLLLVAWNMSDAKHFIHMLRVAPKSDVAVLLSCYILTVAFDMVIGVSVGMVLAAFLFMHRMAAVTKVGLAEGEPAAALPGPIPPGVVVYGIWGPLFFGAAQKAMATLETIDRGTKVVILLMHEVRAMDASGLVALESALEPLHKRGCLAILSGVQPQPRALLDKAGLARSPGVIICDDARQALITAERHCLTSGRIAADDANIDARAAEKP